MKGYLTIDIGTTSWKTSIFNRDGSMACGTKRYTKTVVGPGNIDYYDPAMMWDSIIEMVKELSLKFSLQDLEAVSVTSMGESVVPIGIDGKPLFPIIPWFDSRSVSEAESIKQKIGGKRVYEITGSEAGAIFSLPKILWMRNNYPEIYKKAVKWLQMTDYVNYMLTGEFVTDYSMACRTLAFDLNTCEWSTEILDSFELSHTVLPKVIKTGTVIGTITKTASKIMSLPENLPVVMGGHDHPMASITGCTFGNDMLFDSSGTAEPFMYVSQKGAKLPSLNVGQRLTRHPDPDRYIIWGGIVSSGAAVDWSINRLALCREWGFDIPDMKYDDIFNKAKDLPAGSEGLLFHPHIRGSGAPYWDTRFKGAFLGLTSDHTSVHMLRAVLEGLSLQARLLVEMHEKITDKKIALIRCMGGGARISMWQQIKADVTGCIVETGLIGEATSLGAAITAAFGKGHYDSIEEAAKDMGPKFKAYYPDKSKTEKYSDLFEIYKESYNALKEVNHKLDKFRG